MMLRWDTTSDFLPRQGENCVFLSLPTYLRKSLALTVSQYLNKNSAIDTFSNNLQFSVIFELLGQSLGLGTSEKNLLLDVLSIYKRWFLEGDHQDYFKGKYFVYVSELIKHVALLVTAPTAPEHVPTQCNLVLRFLDLIFDIVKKTGPLVDSTVFYDALESYIGICNYCFTSKLGPRYQSLIEEVFDMYAYMCIQLNICDSKSWHLLYSYFLKWRNSSDVIEKWAYLSNSLTELICENSLLPDEEKICLRASKNEKYSVVLEKGSYYFFWFRFLNILGDLSTTESPMVFEKLLYRVRQVACRLFKYASAQDSKSSEDGQMLLSMFRQSTFDLLREEHQPQLELGKSDALHIVLAIFSKFPGNYDLTQLSYMYYFVQKYISMSNNMLCKIICVSVGIFSINYPGIKCLIPAYWWGMKQVYEMEFMTKRLDTDVNKLGRSYACLSNALTSYANIYGATTFGEISVGTNGLFGASPTTPLSTLHTLNTYLLKTFRLSLTVPTMVVVIKVLFVSICESHKEIPPDFPVLFVQETSSLMSAKDYDFELCAVVLQTWTDLAHLFNYIRILCSALPHLIIQSLNALLNALFQLPFTNENIELIILCYQCLTQWVSACSLLSINYKSSDRDKNFVLRLFNCFFLCFERKLDFFTTDIELVSDQKLLNAPPQQVKEAATHAMMFVMNFADWLGQDKQPDPVSVSLDKELEPFIDGGSNVRTFAFKDCIFSIIAMPDRATDTLNILTVSYSRGDVRTWTFKRPLQKLCEPIDKTVSSFDIAVLDDLNMFNDAGKSLHYQLTSYMNENQKYKHKMFVELVHESINQYRTTERPRSDQCSETPRVSVCDAPSSLQDADGYLERYHTYSLATQLGWNDIDNLPNIFLFENANTPSNTPNYPLSLILSEEQKASQLPFSIGVVYLPNGYTLDRCIHSPVPISESPTFTQFIDLLGTATHWSKHSSLSKLLDGVVECQEGPKSVLYYDYLQEAVFHVSTTLSSSPNVPQSLVSNLLLSPLVSVIWAENYSDYREHRASLPARLHIVINPVMEFQYRVYLLSKDDKRRHTFGPLKNKMLVTQRSLSFLVRATAINFIMAHEQQWYYKRQCEAQRRLESFIKDNTLKTVSAHMLYTKEISNPD
ncbi:uncharacterized protein LOC126323242 isoform X1 [Schistocerca gregaria]|uniref:uncharacterized protein LOC126323242 isoform X1 n=1 Tax=Schistocerca gregaria TaxID=7010 RepID=UPI00211ED926|nr:uncharacterized protein LOC126323242 isoform X1 [Schistocerca gregaria]